MSAAPSQPRRKGLKTYLSFVKFEHTLFALPFAYGGMLLAADGWPGFVTFFWITLAMVGARTASMALNRVIDAEIDARNPRTRAREIPSGVLRKREGVGLAVVGFALLIVSGWALNALTLALFARRRVLLGALPLHETLHLALPLLARSHHRRGGGGRLDRGDRRVRARYGSAVGGRRAVDRGGSTSSTRCSTTTST